MKNKPWMGRRTLWGGVVVALAVAAGAGWWWTQGRAPEVSYRTGKIERGSLSATVSASGTVNPVTQVSVGTQVSGQIKDLLVDFNSEVKAGQLIALIDPETFEYRVRQSQADVEAAQAAVLTAQANSAAARAAVSRAQVDLAEAQRDADRKKMLVERQFIAQSEADKAMALVNTSGESVKSAQAQLAVADAQVRSAQANVAQRVAALAQARVDLARTRITSPVSGIVIKRAVERGQTVAASLQAPELFVIAQNLQDMQVDASIDESDVGRIRTGQKATFTVDAFPGQNFDGEIRQVRKAAQNVANVVTYVAVVGFQNNGGRLLPGMTANVRVVTDQRENVLKVPNAALRVRIAGLEPVNGGAGGAAAGGTGAAGGSAAPAASGASGASIPGGAQKPASSATSWLDALLPPAFAQPAGGMSLRERLTQELGLTPEQQAKVDAISTELRPQFMALRELPEAERGPARDKLQAQMRQRVAAVLTPEQRAKYAASAASPGTGAAGHAGASAPVSVATNQGGAPTGSPNASKTASAAAPAGGAGASALAKPAASASAAAAPGAPSAPVQANGGSAGAGAGGPASEFRNRLVTELQLTPAQVEKLDAIYADARPRFMQLRDLPAEERGKARERIMADMRARIGDLLTPEQKPRYAALQAEAASRTSSRGRIHLLGEDGKPVAYNVRLGITDGTSTELIVAPGSPEAEALKEGATVITAVIGAGSGGTAQRPASAGPRLPF